MLPTHTIKHPPQRRSRPQPRARPATLEGSGSIFTTIRKLVTAPLNWFSLNPEFENVDGKRKINGWREGHSAGYTEGSQPKKMRVDAPIPTESAYLDPPSSTFEPTGLSVPIKQLTLDSSGSSFATSNKYTPRASPFKDRRNMSIDPIPRDSTVPRDPIITRNPSKMPLTRESSVDMRASMPFGRESSMPPPPTPFRLRTSLTPKPSPTKPLRREASAPPPLASLMSNPIFVKPPPQPPRELSPIRKLGDQTTVSLGSLLEARRASHSPARDHSFGNFGHVTRFQSQIPYGSNGPARASSAAEKLLHDLDLYKTPILPTRYNDATVVPEFLRPRKAHVPIPMSKKGRDIKPSLGMAQKGKTAVRGEAKPYAGQGGLRALLARRKAEEDEERVKATAALKEQKSMKDVGVSAKLTSDSEDEHRRKSKASRVEILPLGEKEPLPYVRERASGRVGPTRTSRREVARAPALSRNKNNKFSAVFDDDDWTHGDKSEDAMEEEDRGTKDPDAIVEDKKGPVYEAPAGFSFAKDTAPIAHDHNDAKEPPVLALPFSLNPSTRAAKNAEKPKPPVSTQTGEAGPFSISSQPQSAPFSFAKPIAVPDVLSDDPKKSSVVPPIPSFALSPPTPEHPTILAQAVEPVAPAPSAAPAPSGLTPNFFANSVLLNPKPADAPKPITPPAIPVKDAENPFWDGDKKSVSSTAQPVASDSLFGKGLAPPNTVETRPRSTSPKPSPFGGFKLPSSLPKTAELSQTGSDTNTQSLFADQAKQSSPFAFSAPAPTVPKEVVPASTNAPTPVFAFGSKSEVATTSVSAPSTSAGRPGSFGAISSSSTGGLATPTPTFTFGAPAAAPLASAQPATADSTTKSPIPFSFSAAVPQAATTGLFEAPKSPFSFGTPPATSPAQAEKKEPFSFASLPTPSGSPFTFGVPSSNTNAGTDKTVAPSPSPSPFSLGLSSQTAVKTPPRQEDNEMRMEESPTRDVNGKPTAESKVSTSFSFGAPSSTPFQSSTGTGFIFGAPASPLNASDTKADRKSPGFFTRTASAPASSTPFSFGQKIDNPAPSAFGTAAPSSIFGQPSSSSTPFSFNAPAPASPSNLFGAKPPQTEAPAPSSPSHFGNSTSSFSFSAPSPNVSNPFNFGGSQPASPALGNTGLPKEPASTTAPAPGVFTFGQPTTGAANTSPSPFGAPAAGSPGGAGALFNIGAPPPSTTPGGAPRQVKGLPRRKFGASGKR